MLRSHLTSPLPLQISDPSPQSTSLENKFGYKREMKPSFTPYTPFTTVCAPRGYPTPTSGPGGYPSPAHGPGGYPSPAHGPEGYPTPTSGLGGYLTPTPGPGGYPTPTSGPGGKSKPVQHVFADCDPKGKGRAAGGCYDDSVDDAIDIDELFEGYETADDSLVPDLNWELQMTKDFGSDSGMCLAATVSPRRPTPVCAMRPSSNSPAASLPSMRSAWDPSTSAHSCATPQQRAVLASPLQQGTHHIHTTSYPLQPTKPFTQPSPQLQPRPLTQTTEKRFTFKERTPATQTSACSSGSTAIPPTNTAQLLTPAKTPLHQKQSLMAPSALLHAPTGYQRASLQLRNLIPTFNTFNVKPPTTWRRQGESSAHKYSDPRMDPSTGQHTAK